jgi:hypothetical protein
MKRKSLLLLLLLNIVMALSAQSRFLPLGQNGTSLQVTSRFSDAEMSTAAFDAGFGLGGRLDFRLAGGVLFTEIEGESETIPTFDFVLDVIVIKQQKSVPFSLLAGIGYGLAYAVPDNKAIFGTRTGFEVAVSHDFWIKSLLLGVHGSFQYDLQRYDIRSPSSAEEPTSFLREHQYVYGFGADIGFTYSGDNLLIASGDILWNESSKLEIQIGMRLLIPKSY